MAPWGGVRLSYGNNPISYAIPAGRELPLVLDIAIRSWPGGRFGWLLSGTNLSH